MADRTRILFVDDDPDVLSIVKKGLELRGYSVETVSDPELAARGYQAGRYDLIIIDYRMPRMNGVELFEKISNVDNKVKAYFLTAWNVELEEMLKALVRDGHGLVRKPVSIKDLDNTMKVLMEH